MGLQAGENVPWKMFHGNLSVLRGSNFSFQPFMAMAGCASTCPMFIAEMGALVI